MRGGRKGEARCQRTVYFFVVAITNSLHAAHKHETNRNGEVGNDGACREGNRETRTFVPFNKLLLLSRGEQPVVVRLGTSLGTTETQDDCGETLYTQNKLRINTI